ncbi:MAG TPA: Fur family transcriptional regulator [Clostridia bacterium]|nr:Fur family transcriptional regulator [Clostridia bacterium]
MKDLSRLEMVLKEKGYKLTEQRRLIIEAFNESPGHYTAQEIFDKVREKLKGINFSTIYRNLELLSALEIINKLYIESGISHYELCGLEHHHHIICKKCGETREIDICPYINLGEEQLEAIGFKATDHKFEIYGYCSKCSNSKQ